MILVKYIYLFFAFLIFIGCSDYQKLLNSDNVSEKYKVAESFYNNGNFRKASRLFEQIIPKYRGKPQAQRIVYFLADSY
ncbi:MAG: outer membrane protein assembly factor BamD, partial [Flavobacteriaceae bacterium]